MICGGRVKYDVVDDGIQERKQDRICYTVPKIISVLNLDHARFHDGVLGCQKGGRIVLWRFLCGRAISR